MHAQNHTIQLSGDGLGVPAFFFGKQSGLLQSAF